MLFSEVVYALFQSTSSARRTTRTVRGATHTTTNFNPRPPRGGRLPVSGCSGCSIGYFNPRPPRGGRPLPYALKTEFEDFNPRPPRGGRLSAVLAADKICYFNPRPPRGGRLDAARCGRHFILISIHVLREEDDRACPPTTTLPMNFNPRPPRGGRRLAAQPKKTSTDFNPRPPRGGRPMPKGDTTVIAIFQSTSSARRTTHHRLV